MHSKYPEKNTELFHYKHLNCVKSHPPPLFSLSAPPLFFFNIWFMYIARLNAFKFTVTCIPVSSQDDIFFSKNREFAAFARRVPNIWFGLNNGVI